MSISSLPGHLKAPRASENRCRDVQSLELNSKANLKSADSLIQQGFAGTGHSDD